MLCQFPRRPCGLSFESWPAWIWAFRLSDWDTIYVTDADELRLRQYHSSTWSFVKDKIKIIFLQKQVLSMGPAVDLWFVSGSRDYVEQFGRPHGCAVVIWLERCGRRRPQDSVSSRWFSVSHEVTGGSTTARGVFGQEGLDELEIPHDVLRQSISHIMKFSVRPDSCTMPVMQDHYLLTHRLSVHHSTKKVVYETGFSRTGWGSRCLVDTELAQAFDLPPYVTWNSSFTSSIVPIQILRVVVDAVLNLLRPESQPKAGPRRRLMEMPSVEALALDLVWLPSLSKWLPGSWANIAISDKAVKSDDATIERFPWNQRISLVLPLATAIGINGMECLGLHWWKMKLFGSFVRYLGDRYGPHWRQDVVALSRGRSGFAKRKLEGQGGAVHDKGGS